MTVVCITDEIVERRLARWPLAPLLVRAIADDLRKERIRRAGHEFGLWPEPGTGPGHALGEADDKCAPEPLVLRELAREEVNPRGCLVDVAVACESEPSRRHLRSLASVSGVDYASNAARIRSKQRRR
jgi:hypothetical protein